MKEKKEFLSFQVDHMTLLLQPELYKVAYLTFHVIFGVGPDDLLYEKGRNGNNHPKRKLIANFRIMRPDNHNA